MLLVTTLRCTTDLRLCNAEIMLRVLRQLMKKFSAWRTWRRTRRHADLQRCISEQLRRDIGVADHHRPRHWRDYL
jgi:hypothetical protein